MKLMRRNLSSALMIGSFCFLPCLMSTQVKGISFHKRIPDFNAIQVTFATHIYLCIAMYALFCTSLFCSIYPLDDASAFGTAQDIILCQNPGISETLKNFKAFLIAAIQMRRNTRYGDRLFGCVG